MKKKTKNIIFYITIFFFFAFYVGARQLETDYPGAGFSTTNTPINVYVRYLFGFISGIAGLFALLSLTIGGFQYLTSLGNPTETQNAIKKIISSFLGLIIILGGWIILWRINYSLINLSDINTTPVAPILSQINNSSPILFCKEDINYINDVINETLDSNYRMTIAKEIIEKCIFIYKGPIIDPSWRDPEVIYIFPNKNQNHYGVILYSNNYEKGQVVYNLTSSVKEIKPMSESIFFTDPFSMVKEGFNSYDFKRDVKIYKYYQGKDNPFNLEIDNKEIDGGEPIFYTEKYSTSSSTNPSVTTTETIPVKTFFWGSFKIIGSVYTGRTLGYIPNTIIIFFPFETMSEPPNWDNGESSKIFITTNYNINLNATVMKNWGKWEEGISLHSKYDCSDKNAPPSCGACNWVWEDTGSGTPEWNNTNPNVCISPCGYCYTPSSNGTFIGETNTTFCEEPEEREEEEIPLLPCSAGMIIISGSFGIF